MLLSFCSPLPKSSVPYPREPMIDNMIFREATRVRRIPNSFVPVPHGFVTLFTYHLTQFQSLMFCLNDVWSRFSGLKSEQQENYQLPNDVKSTQDVYCPIDTPYELPRPGTKSTFAAPLMYNTEYQNIGSKKPVTVPGKVEMAAAM